VLSGTYGRTPGCFPRKMSKGHKRRRGGPFPPYPSPSCTQARYRAGAGTWIAYVARTGGTHGIRRARVQSIPPLPYRPAAAISPATPCGHQPAPPGGAGNRQRELTSSHRNASPRTPQAIAEATGVGELLPASGDVNTVPVHIAVLLDDGVTEVDPDAELEGTRRFLRGF
jgi:hypothetical protein